MIKFLNYCVFLFLPVYLVQITLFSGASLNLLDLLLLTTICLNLFLIGLFVYAFIAANSAFVLNNCLNEKERQRTVSIMFSGYNLGAAISAVIISFLASRGYPLIFLLSALMIFCTAVILFFTQSKKESKVLLAKSHALKKEPIGIVSKSKCRKLILVGTLFIVFIVGLVVSQWGTTYTLYINNTFPSLGIHAVSILFIMNTVLIVVFQSLQLFQLNQQQHMFCLLFVQLLLSYQLRLRAV